MSQSAINIAIVDNDKLVVQLLADYFSAQPDFEVCLTAHGGNLFIQQLEQSDTTIPDIVLLDLKMPDGDGVETSEHLNANFPQIKKIILSSYYKPSFVSYMLKLNVAAFLPKETDKLELLEIIREVHTRGHYLSSEQMEAIRKQLPTKKASEFSAHKLNRLTDRETEVLRLICNQFTAKEIGKKLFLSPKTIEAHKGNLLVKTGAKNTVGLIIYAIQNNLINPDELLLL